MDESRMRNGCLLVLALFCGMSCPWTWGQTRSSLRESLAPLVARLPDPRATVGVCVLDLQTATSVYEYNADGAMIPASTLKLFVMAAGVDVLGADFCFETVLATDGANLIVVGDGDPAFGDEKIHKARGETITSVFDRWADLLIQEGRRHTSGDLILDESIFDDVRLHPSWDRADHGKWYAAQVSSLNMNDNCLDITVRPGPRPNDACDLSVQPAMGSGKIINQCRSHGKGSPVVNFDPRSNAFVISGRTNQTWDLGSVAFPDPGLLFADSMRSVWKQHGVSIAGSIRRRRVRSISGGFPEPIEVIDRHKTPLADVLQRIGKDSQNLFAECLIKRTGYEWARRRGLPNPQGSWPVGAEAVLETVRRAGLETAGLQVADGSGLSRDNRCTARQLASILAWMHRSPHASLFRESLSVAGNDGSMKKRLHDVRGRVFCKTGTIRGVRSLAGLVESVEGRWYAFAVMFNGYKGSSTPYKDIQDRICRVLVGNAPPAPIKKSPAKSKSRS